MGAVGFIPWGDINTQNQAQVGDQVAMVAMRRPPAFEWIVIDLCDLLFAIDWFDRGIHVQYPVVPHYRMQRNCQVLLQPDFRFFLINGFQSSPHRVVTANIAHSQQRRIDAIMPQGVEMGIAPTVSHNGQNHRAKYIPDLWCVRAAELQRTVRDKWLEQTGLFQDVDEKQQLTKRRNSFVRRPASMNPAPKLSGTIDSFESDCSPKARSQEG